MTNKYNRLRIATRPKRDYEPITEIYLQEDVKVSTFIDGTNTPTYHMAGAKAGVRHYAGQQRFEPEKRR